MTTGRRTTPLLLSISSKKPEGTYRAHTTCDSHTCVMGAGRVRQPPRASMRGARLARASFNIVRAASEVVAPKFLTHVRAKSQKSLTPMPSSSVPGCDVIERGLSFHAGASGGGYCDCACPWVMWVRFLCRHCIRTCPLSLLHQHTHIVQSGHTECVGYCFYVCARCSTIVMQLCGAQLCVRSCGRRGECGAFEGAHHGDS